MPQKSIAITIAAFLLAALLLSACSQAPPSPSPITSEPPASREEMARHYAPIIYQGAASDQDYISAVNFDNDWVGNNNWEHQPTGDLRARVYYSVIETDTHWYLFYALFHPRDYTDEPCAESDGCHENDMESLQVIVVKDGSEFGQPLALLTLAHSHIYLYNFDSSVKRGALKVAGKAKLDEGHPVVWVETFGHGIYGKPQALAPGKIIYRLGNTAERPADIKDADVPYELVPIYDTLWPRRQEIGPGKLFDKPFSYRGHTLPASFDGDDWGEDKANAPWGYNQEIGNILSRGDFFLDPSRAFTYFTSVQGGVSQKYLFNPYLDDLK